MHRMDGNDKPSFFHLQRPGLSAATMSQYLLASGCLLFSFLFFMMRTQKSGLRSICQRIRQTAPTSQLAKRNKNSARPNPVGPVSSGKRYCDSLNRRSGPVEYRTRGVGNKKLSFRDLQPKVNRVIDLLDAEFGNSRRRDGYTGGWRCGVRVSDFAVGPITALHLRHQDNGFRVWKFLRVSCWMGGGLPSDVDYWYIIESNRPKHHKHTTTQSHPPRFYFLSYMRPTSHIRL